MDSVAAQVLFPPHVGESHFCHFSVLDRFAVPDG